MERQATTPQPAVKRFWDRFIENLLKNGVKGKATRWYVVRTEQYLKAFADRRLSDHVAADVAGYLESVGRKGVLEDWQFLQLLDAIQNLLRTAGASAADEVDWAFWRDSARALAPNHPTVAREALSSNNEAVSGARFKQKRNAPSFLDRVRSEHGRVLERLVAEVRRCRYSIRTEQAYESWGNPGAVYLSLFLTLRIQGG